MDADGKNTTRLTDNRVDERCPRWAPRKSGVQVTWTYSRSLYGEDLRFARYYGSEGTMTDLGFPFHPFQGGGNAELADGSSVPSAQIQIEYLMSLGEEEKAALFPYGSTDGFAIEVWDFVNAIAEGRKPEMGSRFLSSTRALALAPSGQW